MDDTVTHIPLRCLRAHPGNANVMSEGLLAKLAAHIERTGRYPPLIVRPMPDEPGDPGHPGSGHDPGSGPGVYQVLDGHHRWAALERAGHESAACVVWDVDDEAALVLLATLNRLQGQDHPKRRAALLGELRDRFGRGAAELAKLLPESAAQASKYLDLAARPPRVREPRPLAEMPAAVHFFLTGDQRRRLEAALSRIGGSREEALMAMVGNCTGGNCKL